MMISLRDRSRGFTLVEIAIVLTIAALLIAAGIGLSAAVIDNARTRATRQAMDTVKLALLGFISRNGRLPCPSVETRAPSHAAYGIEDTVTTNPATSCTNTVNLPGQAGPPFIDAAKRGVVPWKTLGIPAENARDGWGNQITYMVSVTATTINFDTVSGMRGSLYVHSTTPVAAGLPATGNQINACSTTANDNVCNKAAVVMLISHGRNILGAFTPDGVRSPLPTGAAELENTGTDRFVVNAEPSATFDDILQPLAPDDFLGPLAAQGTIKSERALLVERVRQVVTLIASEAVSSRTGAPGTYNYALPAPTSTAAYAFNAAKFDANCSDFNPPTVAGVLPAGHDGKQVLDPWGREFRYAVANYSVFNSSESCPNPAVLISLGPDGTLATADDWVYYAPLAEWKDVFAKAGW